MNDETLPSRMLKEQELSNNLRIIELCLKTTGLFKAFSRNGRGKKKVDRKHDSVFTHSA